MIPTLFRSSNIQFQYLGKGKLAETISCIIHEELNGEYEMTLRYPLTGKRYSDLVAVGTIGAIAPVYTTEYSYYSREEEFFDIDRIAKPIDGIVEFKANHISRRLAKKVFRDSTLPLDQMQLVLTHSVPTTIDGLECSMSGNATSGTLTVPSPKSSLSVLIGSENSVVADFGGDFFFESKKGISTGPDYLKLTIHYMEHRGEDRGASIRFGVNMLNVEQEKDMTGAYNAVVPFWDDGNGNITYVSGYIVQPTTPITPIIAVPLDLSNDFDTQPTDAQMVTLARQHLDTKTPWTGSETIKVDFINGVEIDPHAPDIQLGDTVHVYWGDADIATDLRVVAYDYDVLAERYISLELGTPQKQYVAVTGESYAGPSGGGGGGGGGGDPQIYSQIINGHLNVRATASTDLGLSLTLPAGTYIVTYIAKFYSSGTVYVAANLTNNSAMVSNQGSSTGSLQVPLQYTTVITLTEETTIKPSIYVTGSGTCVFFDNRSISAVLVK